MNKIFYLAILVVCLLNARSVAAELDESDLANSPLLRFILEGSANGFDLRRQTMPPSSCQNATDCTGPVAMTWTQPNCVGNFSIAPLSQASSNCTVSEWAPLDSTVFACDKTLGVVGTWTYKNSTTCAADHRATFTGNPISSCINSGIFQPGSNLSVAAFCSYEEAIKSTKLAAPTPIDFSVPNAEDIPTSPCPESNPRCPKTSFIEIWDHSSTCSGPSNSTRPPTLDAFANVTMDQCYYYNISSMRPYSIANFKVSCLEGNLLKARLSTGCSSPQLDGYQHMLPRHG